MEIRPLTEEEQKYTYEQSMQLRMQTGSIGVMHGGYKRNHEFYSRFYHLNEQWKTGGFMEDLDEVRNTLCSDERGFLQDLSTMRAYMVQHPGNSFPGKEGTEYGFRVDTEKYAYLIRCNPAKFNDNVEFYCYEKKWLDRHIQNAGQGIRFINSSYTELFRIPDGGKIVIFSPWREREELVCRYIDEYHMEVGNNLYHICEFAERMERSSSVYEPVKASRILELHTQSGAVEQVFLTVSAYPNNTMYVGLMADDGGTSKLYGNVTVNLMDSVPSYCAFVDTENMPELEEFLERNGIAECSSLSQKRNNCSFPLYVFNPKRLRELCPDGMDVYEKIRELDFGQEKRNKSR